ncbi:type I phosphomannose isomerase catalytic subunit [Bacillus weihaiensis]|uniref:Phosphohexomutase n=1 Tax=Bacillus weihaiensis TaxID=1547283 RepID=A0A1L3MMW2_9BACI|nr:type I phosphomannose isomerase catalytic subunit [Bacillus weihaiensis]APH03688.1 mannose-6-phosphate isomerase [Bacillus weihaiensis]
MDKNIKEKHKVKPIKLSSNRVWRTYLGGKLLDEWQGLDQASDQHFPEEWIMSITSARNTGREHLVNEGLGMVSNESGLSLKELITSSPQDMLGKKHVEKVGPHTGVLVKIIDSSERLAVQVHPDRKMAKELFQSDYGKTECWHILGGREIDGEPPYVYLGFKPGITKEKWRKIFEEQNIDEMLACMHKIYVKPGETYLLEGGIPHAIGSGCFLVEIQEPTDLTIRTERTSPSGFQIADNMCHQGIGFDKMFECFRYEGYTREETLEKWKVKPELIEKDPFHSETEVIGYNTTPYFRMTMVEVRTEVELKTEGIFTGLYVLSGKATIDTDQGKESLEKADQFFIPANIGTYKLTQNGDEPLKVLRLFGPKIS